MLPSNRTLGLVLALLAAPALAACGGQPAPAAIGDTAIGEAASADEGTDDGPGVELRGQGSFTCDLTISSALPFPEVPPIIERDRMLMAGQPGIITKHLPIALDPSTGNILSGGRYLFDTFDHAQAYADFVLHGYVLDGVQFVQRPYFLDHACYPWRVVGARAFASIEHQVVLRTERFQVSGSWGDLKQVYLAARDAAPSRGLTAVWLVANEDLGMAQLVYYIDRVAPPDPNVPDFASYEALAGAPALGDAVAPASWQRILDQTHWVFTDWFPYEAGDTGRPSLWPNSPPFPGPYCGDGVCEPSRGEAPATCPADCAPACGDGVCDAGETTDTCPTDCRI